MNRKRLDFLIESDNEFFKAIDLPFPYNRPKSQWNKLTDDDKSVNYADVHEPYSHEDLMDQSLINKDALVARVIGDLSDWYSKSRFVKKRQVDFKMELRETFKRIEWLSTHYKQVEIMVGNHDNRPEKLIRGLLSATGSVDMALLTEQNLLARLISFFDNVKLVGTKIETYDKRTIDVTHIYQVGDIIFTHAEMSKTQATALLERISNFLHLWKKHFNLKPYSVIMQAHNHQSLKYHKGDEWWFAIPCAMRSDSIGAEYIYDTRMIGSPPTLGYTIVYQHKGVTDINRTNQFIYEQ